MRLNLYCFRFPLRPHTAGHWHISALQEEERGLVAQAVSRQKIRRRFLLLAVQSVRDRSDSAYELHIVCDSSATFYGVN